MPNNSLPDLWRSRICACAASGLTTKDWCLSEGFPEHQYYYWKRRLSERHSTDLCDWMGVTVLEPIAAPCITLRVGEAFIDVQHGFDSLLLRNVVSAISGRS